MNLCDRTVLVIGGAGFVGSHTCKALAHSGYNPVTFDNLERGHRWAVKWGPFEEGDIRSESDLRRVFRTWRPQMVIHFAAYAYVGESIQQPAKYYENNVGGTAKLLAACAAHECKNFVFSSTCATYGLPSRLPVRESDEQRPINPYGYSKLIVERMLKEVETANAIKHVVLRYFNASGADPKGELGELHFPETHLIPLVLFTAMGRRSSVEIFGNDYSTPDGTCIRDYIHVSDLAEAHLAAIKWLAAGRESDAFNLGNGQGASVYDVIKTTERVTGMAVKSHLRERRPGDPPILISDSMKAKAKLNWSPKFPNLDQQITHAWNWFREKMPELGAEENRANT